MTFLAGEKVTAAALTAVAPGRLDAACSGNLTVTTSPQNIAGCTLTFTTPTAQIVQVIGVFDVNSTGATDPFRGLCCVDGDVAESEEAVKQSTGRTTSTQTWLVSLTAASHTIKLRAVKNTSSDTVTVNSAHTKIVIDGQGI